MMGAKAWLMRGDRWIPGLIVLGFVVMIIANGTMIWVALGTWTGLTTDESYNRGLAYNETLDQAEARDALGWTVDIATHTTSDGHEAELVVADANGAPIDGAIIVGRFVRPTHEGYDFDVSFSQVGAGRYRAAFLAPLAGQWDLRFEIAKGNDIFRAAERLRLSP